MGTILAAYREFENRVGVISSHKDNKSERVERMKTEGKIEPIGKGRSAKWRRL